MIAKSTENFSLAFNGSKNTYSEDTLAMLNDTKILRYYETQKIHDYLF